MSADQLSKNNPDGTILGQSVTDKISFYGKTPIAQPTNSYFEQIQDSTGGIPGLVIPSITTIYNGPIIADALSTLIRVVNAHREALVNLGLIKGIEE